MVTAEARVMAAAMAAANATAAAATTAVVAAMETANDSCVEGICVVNAAVLGVDEDGGDSCGECRRIFILLVGRCCFFFGVPVLEETLGPIPMLASSVDSR